MNQEKNLIFKINEEEIEVFRFKETADNSKILIPCPKNNNKGAHFTFHPSGICNFREVGQDVYNFLSKENILKVVDAVKKAIEKIDIIKISWILIIDKEKVKTNCKPYLNEKDQEVFDLEECKKKECFELIEEVSNLDFLERYCNGRFIVLICNVDGNCSSPIRNLQGWYHVNMPMLKKYLEKIWDFASS